ncbi:serine protease [Tabrizicola sp. L79]
MAAAVWIGAAAAQDRAWVQVEAQPSLAEAQERASAYAAVLSDVVGYQLGSRWYGIAIGPFDPDTAEATRRQLRAEGLIPRDSFVSDGTNFRDQFWPVGATDAAPPAEAATDPVTAPAAEAAAEVAPEPAAEPVAEPVPEPVAEPEESLAEARQSEAALTREEQMELQRALQWNGFYAAAIDGAFGAGTRRSMAEWQSAMGLEPTGVLTSRQRDMLLGNWRADLAEYGFEVVTEAEAGIEIELPLGLVGFDHYEPPFVHFNALNGSGMTVILISQPGDQSALYGLYDILQTLTIVPMQGERARRERSFEINAANETVASYAFAELSQGLVKGYILVWNPADADRANRVLTQMKATFRPVGNRALDPGMVAMSDAARKGLLAGLELRRPKQSRSGFYVDGTGRVATTVEAVAQCGRITLDGLTDAKVIVADAASGVALLAPEAALAPPAVGALQIAPDRIGAEVAVAGYAYEDTLPAPVLTYGTLEDVQGLDGEPGLKRLGIATLPGDAGGPVIDGTGAVLGMLLPRATGGSRVLPEGVEFAVSAAGIADLMAANGLAPAEAAMAGALAPEDLTRKAMGMTVLVGCWE